MGLPIDFWFDFSCPYAYLASTQRHRLAREAGSVLTPQPFLLGGVFRALGQAQNLSTILSPAKARHNRLDVIRWADFLGVPLASPHMHPNRTVLALRTLLAAPHPQWDALIDAYFRLYWAEQQDLSDPAVIGACLTALGLDARGLLAAAATASIKDELRDRTERALAAGVFGAPAFVVDGQLFWGQDRMQLVVRAAAGWRPDLQQAAFAF